MDDEEGREKILDAIRKLNPKQRVIILGKIAMMQAFDDDDAAIRWFERNRDVIRAQIKDAE
jgi:hypothetical protein